MSDVSFAANVSRPNAGLSEPDYEKMREILRKYPRHIDGKIIQQGGFSILHVTEHRWYLPPEKVHALLQAAERYWKG